MVDQDLENLIDKAGRNDVFALARSLGWKGDAPKWVWNSLCYMVIQNKDKNNLWLQSQLWSWEHVNDNNMYQDIKTND